CSEALARRGVVSSRERAVRTLTVWEHQARVSQPRGRQCRGSCRQFRGLHHTTMLLRLGMLQRGAALPRPPFAYSILR
ncbi:unnamed protein product, partial [Bubo scandiacus]